MASLAFLTALLVATAAAPHRYAPSVEADTPTPVGSGTVRLSADDAERTKWLRRLGQDLGVTDETRVLDLTGDSPGSIVLIGDSPGSIVLIGGQPVGQSWIVGGYPGFLVEGGVRQQGRRGREAQRPYLQAPPFWDQAKLKVNDGFFASPSRAEATALCSHGVTYAVLDRRYQPALPVLDPVAERIYSNQGVEIYRLPC